MSLDARLVVERDGFRLDLALHVPPGEVVALLGPNGAGKTTALRALAGLLPLTDGHIRFGDAVWDAPDAFRRPEQRTAGVVFQDHLLFPHMSTVDNVAFGVRARGASRVVARERAQAWLDRVGLAEFAARRPGALSGGQAQRVALARALATEPDVLLLDEPLAALDAGTRLHVRAELGRHLDTFGGCALLVTHDPVDAMVLADRLVVLEHGTVVQEGPPVEVARRPRTDYVADLVGLNLHRGTARGTAVSIDGGVFIVPEPADGPVHVAFAPSAVRLHRERPAADAWPVEVVGVEPHAHATRVRLSGRPSVLADVPAATVADLRIGPGDRLWATVDVTAVAVYA
ncbi:ABC transporter ATP-binding protein [Saccharothrix violaceirubra]|uniref:Molybdate transport system ATP-binding protein n=1 Tax=Saccharothrix violaceirubra TaxID=413306 RepID=A0A7W7T1I6_9PSEU|nr:ABC transporter ATP-binding protein [Saccharothrix violaceirubra]MBB4964843.1 molybdate transport system ATP-binding protein [Saccharothrix violaceirubra]